METTLNVTTNGRAQIPKKLIDKMGIKAGDQILVVIEKIIKSPTEEKTANDTETTILKRGRLQ